MKSETLSRRAFLGSSAVLGITAYAAKAGGFNSMADTAMNISEIETIPLSLRVRPVYGWSR